MNRPPIWADPHPQNEAPKFPEEAGGAGCLHLQTALFVDPWMPKRLLWLPTGPCPAGPPLNVLSHLCSINTLFLSFPRQLPCRGCSTQLRIKTPTLLLLPKSCPSQRLCELSDKNKATDKTGLRREQDEIQKMRKSRDRNRQNTNARRCYYFSPFTGLSSI